MQGVHVFTYPCSFVTDTHIHACIILWMVGDISMVTCDKSTLTESAASDVTAMTTQLGMTSSLSVVWTMSSRDSLTLELKVFVFL